MDRNSHPVNNHMQEIPVESLYVNQLLSSPWSIASAGNIAKCDGSFVFEVSLGKAYDCNVIDEEGEWETF